jgi:hypothetical protein
MEDRAGERNGGNYQLTIYTPSQDRSGWEGCFHWTFNHWRTHLLKPETLPDLQSVGWLQINEGGNAKLDYRILIDLAIHCPNLKCLECHIGMEEWEQPYRQEPAKLFLCEYDGPRRDTRHDFRKAVTHTNMPKSLQRIELNSFCRLSMNIWDYIDHRKPMPNLISPLSKDSFSNNIRISSYHLKELTLHVQADETLFWPEDNSTPIWPHLQLVSIMFHIVSPSGAWYFEGLRGEGRDTLGYAVNDASYPPLEHTDEDEDDEFEVEECGRRSFEEHYSFQYRISPNEKVLRPFFSNFAKAAANMPALRQAVLWSLLRFDVDGGEPDEREPFMLDYSEFPRDRYQHGDLENLAWGLAYYKPNYRSYFTNNPAEFFSNARRIWWKVGKWRPDPELHDLFQQIGRREHGKALEEHWKDERHGERLVTRIDFEDWRPEDDYNW